MRAFFMGKIVLDNIDLTYHTEEGDLVIFNKMSVELGPVGLISIVGESGSGKSTFLNLLAGYLSPDDGTIDLPCPIDQVGFIFQDLYLIDHLNVIDNVSLPLIIRGAKKSVTRIKCLEALKEVGIENLAERNIDQISGGQKARVGIARSLVLNTRILLADEPTGSLDSKNAENIMKLLLELSKTRLVILVSHDEKLTYKYSSAIYRIDRSKLVLIKGQSTETEAAEKGALKLKGIRFKENLSLAFSFLKKRLLKVCLSLCFIGICFGTILTMTGFVSRSQQAVSSIGKDYFDYSLVTLSERKSYAIPGQKMNLLKKVRLSESEEKALKNDDGSLIYYPSLDYFFPSCAQIKTGGSFLEESVFFSPCFPDNNKLASGKVMSDYEEVVVNSSFIKASDGRLRLGSMFSVDWDFVVKTDFKDTEADDLINSAYTFSIVGISRELDILSRPTVYYSYELLKEHIYGFELTKASEVYQEKIDLGYRLENMSDEDDILTSFKTVAYTLDPLGLKESILNNHKEITIVSLPLEMASSFGDIVSSFSKIIIILLFLALGCSCLLELVVVENLYLDRKEEMAIYLSFHISKKEFFKIGRGQIYILGTIILSMAGFFNLIEVSVINKVLSLYKFPINLAFEPFSLEFFLMALGCFMCAFITSEIPLRGIYSSDLVLSLKGE